MPTTQDKPILYVDWSKRRVIRKGLGKGTYYATYWKLDKGLTFAHWNTRKSLKQDYTVIECTGHPH